MKVILWCNGDLPSDTLAREITSSKSLIFGVDGGADKASSMGYDVSKVLGDLDSVKHSVWEDKSIFSRSK